MNIILVGCGKVGNALVKILYNEGHNITVIDINPNKINQITEELDVMGIVGNGSSISVLEEADFENAGVLIAVTGSDELNLLCCMFAKKAGHCRCVARVRNPLYSQEIEFIKQQLGISTIINPELATARELSRVLRFPSASHIDTFADGKVRLIKFELKDAYGFDRMPLKDISDKYGCDVLICAVERGHDVIIPDGNFVLSVNDVVTVLATKENAVEYFKKLHLQVAPVKNTLIVGGGAIAYYLAKDLLEHNINVKILERELDRCEYLAEMLPEATIIHGDGTDRQLLLAEGIADAESFVALTNLDEENMILSMFAKKQGVGTRISKINRFEFDELLDELDIGKVVFPKHLTCDFILQYIRALQNEKGSNVKTLYQILGNRVEVVEFAVTENSEFTDIPLSQLKLKPNQLICCIIRGDQVIIPRGKNMIKVGDTVIVVSLNRGLNDLDDIIAN